MTVDSRYGELSRPMRNRALEIHLLESEDVRPDLKPLHSESAIARFRQCKTLGTIASEETSSGLAMALLQDHLAVGDHNLAPRFVKQLISGLYRGFPVDQELNITAQFGKAREQVTALYEHAVGQKQVSADFARVQVSPAFTICK